MRQILLSLFIILFLTSCSSASKTNNVNNSNSIVGKMSWNEWLAKTKWDITPTYDFYFPDEKKIEKILKLIEDKSYSFVVFATNSCEECREYIPKAFKILHKLGFTEDKIELYGLNSNLEEPSGEYLKYNIPTVPTIYVKKDDKIIAEVSYPFMWLESFIEIFEENK